MEGPIDIEQRCEKGCESIIQDLDCDHWENMMRGLVCGWMYWIVTGVTSDIGVLSRHLARSSF